MNIFISSQYSSIALCYFDVRWFKKSTEGNHNNLPGSLDIYYTGKLSDCYISQYAVMKKRFRQLFIIVIAAVVLYAIVFAYSSLPILTGFSAKAACSCVFLSGRTVADVKREELAGFLFSLADVSVNPADSSATANVWGLAQKKAIYRKGLGCTLVNDITEKELRTNVYLLADKPAVNQDSLKWPLGNKNADSTFANIDTAILKKAFAYAFQTKNNKAQFGTRSLIALYNGKIVQEQHAPGFNGAMPQTGWSMTKSITNALIGILVKEGKVRVEDNHLFASWNNDERSAITIENLLHATSGLQWQEVYTSPSSATNMLYRKDDMAGYAMTFSQSNKPGAVFQYSSGTSNMLSYIVRQHTNGNYYRFPYEALFHKLGMYSATIEPDASGTFVGSSYCFASARDWARFGLMYLNDGVTNGERILPEGWVQYTRTPSAAAPKGEYGAQFWLNAGAPNNPADRTYPDVPADCFFAEGFQGQEVWIIPSKDLVVVKLSVQNGDKLDENRFLAEVVSAIR